MLNVAYRTQAINEIRRLADEISLVSATSTPVVGVVAPGPPGIGKTQAALELLADRTQGRLVEPTHDQAKERRQEATKLLRSTNRTHLLARHIQGLGRKCLYLPEDKWAAKAWNFGDVACDGCPSKKQCPGIQQHWQDTDIYLGVHNMANWSKPGLLVIDELPDPVETRQFTSDELIRIGANVWHPILERWRVGFEFAWNRVLTAIEMRAQAFPDPKVWGSTVQLNGLFPVGSSIRDDLDFLCDYFHNSPVPAPPADAVRRGALLPEKWMPADLEFLVRTLRWESDGVPVESRADLGLPYTACVRVYGDSKHNFVDYRIEMRTRWAPPETSHMILDSTAPMSGPVYDKLYANFDRSEAFNVVPLPTEGLELVHYETLGFSRSRSLSVTKNLLKPGVNARVRALRQIIYKVRQVRKSRYDKVKVGIIDHKGLLEACGFDFHNTAVLNGATAARIKIIPDPILEATVSELESIAELTVGYHGGVTGSNLFKEMRVLAVLGDATGHIGMLAEEARTLDMDASTYTRWRVSVNAMQEIFRGRLLDADKANAKTVLYFGRYAPDLTSMGRTWHQQVWPEGGRVPTLAAHAFESAVWEQVGAGPNIIIGSLLPEFAGMHATLIGDALLALRVSDESWEATSPKTRELYRRVARNVAESMGLSGFSVPHPLGGRRPITVFALTAAEASVAMLEVQDYLTSIPSWRLTHVEDLAERADNQRVADEKLQNEVESIRSEVTRLKQEYTEAKSNLLTADWRADSRRDLADPAQRAESEQQRQILEVALADLKLAYRDRIKSELVRWRKLRSVYKEVESLLDEPDDILRFAHKGIVF